MKGWTDSLASDMDLEDARNTTAKTPIAAAPAKHADVEVVDLLDGSSDEGEEVGYGASAPSEPSPTVQVPQLSVAALPRNPPAAVDGTGASLSIEESVFKTAVYAAWRESLAIAKQQYPEIAQTVLQLDVQAKDLALRLPKSIEGGQRFLECVQSWLKQGLGDVRAEAVFSVYKDRYGHAQARLQYNTNSPRPPPYTAQHAQQQQFDRTQSLYGKYHQHLHQQQVPQQQVPWHQHPQSPTTPYAPPNMATATPMALASNHMMSHPTTYYPNPVNMGGSHQLPLRQPTIMPPMSPIGRAPINAYHQAQQAQHAQVTPWPAGHSLLPQSQPHNQAQPEEVQLWKEFYATRPELKVLGRNQTPQNHAVLKREFGIWRRLRSVTESHSGSWQPQAAPLQRQAVTVQQQQPRTSADSPTTTGEGGKRKKAEESERNKDKESHPNYFDEEWTKVHADTKEHLSTFKRSHEKLNEAVQASFSMLGAAKEHQEALEVMAEFSKKMEEVADAMQNNLVLCAQRRASRVHPAKEGT